MDLKMVFGLTVVPLQFIQVLFSSHYKRRGLHSMDCRFTNLVSLCSITSCHTSLLEGMTFSWWKTAYQCPCNSDYVSTRLWPWMLQRLSSNWMESWTQVMFT